MTLIQFFFHCSCHNQSQKILNFFGENKKKRFRGLRLILEKSRNTCRTVLINLAFREREMTSPPAMSSRRSVGDYELIRRIGQGSFATVYEAEHRVTHERFAIKMTKTKLSPKLQANLQSEISILKAIDHTNIVKLFDIVVRFRGSCLWYFPNHDLFAFTLIFSSLQTFFFLLFFFFFLFCLCRTPKAAHAWCLNIVRVEI
jgi:serine/threonine protein kinase